MANDYAGDVTPSKAWEILRDDPDAVLIDVRTAPEWSYVGVPDLRTLGKEVRRISWQTYPAMQVNADFAAEVAAAGVKPAAPVLLLCRSGARSLAAAKLLAGTGFTRAFNISDGFEGPADAEQHRGKRAGWKADNLPWAQS